MREIEYNNLMYQKLRKEVTQLKVNVNNVWIKLS